MLTAMVAACVKNLDDRQALGELATQLLGTHAHLGLGARETEAAKRSLIAASRDVLGADLDPETEAAWSRAISLVAGTMTRH